MEYFDFTLRFDDEDHSLTSKNGLPIEKVGELLLSLSKAVNSDEKNPLILSEVRGNCYALQVSTPVLTIHETLKIVHNKIAHNDYTRLNAEQRKYAIKLKAILGSNLKLNVYDASKEFKAEVTEIVLPKQPECYYEIGSVYGVITAIGGKSVNGRTAIHISKIPYDVEVSSADEAQLIQHYKKSNLRFLIRKKISVEKKEILSAQLESYEMIAAQHLNTAIESSKQSLPPEFYDQLIQEYYTQE